MEKKLVGGQAVIEGVMMRSGNKVATAIRKNKKIVIKKEKINLVGDRYPVLKLPFLRGVVNLIELLIIGIKTLEYSAQEANEEEKSFSKGAMALTITVSLAFGIFLFVVVPYFFTTVLGINEQNEPLGFNLVDGLFRLFVLIGYIAFVGLFKDIKRVFQYHGAEHKAVACYEHKATLNMKNSQRYSTRHTRCGTSFLMFVIIVGIVLFSFVPLILKALIPATATMHGMLRYSVFFASRLIILPVIAGVAYELLRMSARFENNPIVQPILFPGLLIQKLTTREPTNEQVEVAIAALKAVV